jgi:glycine/D-amino acid oxidase-like deaminating enzyme
LPYEDFIMTPSADIVICGAGISGVSAAFFLSRMGARNIIVIDERPPLSLTSMRSTECYRNWWPGAEMAAFMNRSIDLLEELADESGNVFGMNRRGYLYLTADRNKIDEMRRIGEDTAQATGQPLRIHTAAQNNYQPSHAEGWKDHPNGADLILDQNLIRKYFPCVSADAVAAIHARRAGWLSAQQLGMYMIDQAKSRGVRFVQGQVQRLSVSDRRVERIDLDHGESIRAGNFVNASGPFFKNVGSMAGLDLPVHTELHLKVAFKDVMKIIDRDAPLLIWNDKQFLDWDNDEREMLAEDESTRWMLDEFPAGIHTRPEGLADSPMAIFLWEYQTQVLEPIIPPPLDENYPEIVLRGMARMIPGLKKYFGKAPKPILDGGYYTKTRENRPLIGSTSWKNYFLIGAVSGYGIMASCAAGDLLAKTIIGSPLPEYASAFALARYDDAEYLKRLDEWAEGGQL